MENRLLLVFLAGFLVVLSSCDACPNRCLCYRTTVRCMFLQMEEIPTVSSETTILDLRFNRITEVKPEVFRGMSNLNTLLLNNNHIKKIRNGAFEGLSSLRYLYLYKNEISTIEGKAFHGLDKLEQLYIHFNQIEDLDSDTFVKLPSLERLFLHNNQLKRLPKGVFSQLDSLRRLRLDSNALICDCQMLWLSQMLKSHEGYTQAAAVCEQPSDMQGKSILSISEDDFQCDKPEITSEPSDVEVSFGSTAYFKCRAEGDPEPEISWLHNNEEIITNQVDRQSRYKVLEDGTLMIEDTRDVDQGIYECVARNAAGQSKAAAAELRYYGHEAAPELLQRPRDVQVVVGETISMDCRASGHPRPQVTWSKDDGPLPRNPRYTVEATGTLNIVDVEAEDAGFYRCTAANSLASISDEAAVQILVPPTFARAPSDQSASNGETVIFTCEAEGVPAPTVTWTRDGRSLPESGRYEVSVDTFFLTISLVQANDRGLYECTAESRAGRRSASARLSIIPRLPPVLQRAPDDVNAPAGSRVTFRCDVNAAPAATIRWLRNSVPLPVNQKYDVSEDGALTIDIVNILDEGIYECVAQNVLGSIRAFARLRVGAGSPLVTNNHHRNQNELQPILTEDQINQAVEDSIRSIDRAINTTRRSLRHRGQPRSAHDLLQLMRLPSTDALRLSRSAEIFERTLEAIRNQVIAGDHYNITHKDLVYEELLTPSQLALVVSLSGCSEHRRVVNCEDMCYHLKYRSLDGTCNNLRNPMWGASLTPFNRLVEPFYENGFNTPRGWDPDHLYNGFRLPSARQVSLSISSTETITSDEEHTHMLMQWGQFLDHDITFTPQAVSNARFSDGRNCNETCDNQSPCFPIPVPPGDPRIQHHRCMGMTRSSAICGSGTTSVFFEKVFHREQLNQITSFIDASNVYGSSDEESRNLRDFRSNRGLLRTGILMPSGRPLLPPNQGEPVDCQMDANTAHVPCFQAGDHRSNEQLGLLSMHTIWMRQHNRVCGELLRHNPHWDGDLVYHEARKILGAQMQHITYTHWLPKVLGPAGLEMLGPYTGYDPTLDPMILNGFATAAFRFGHALINPFIFRLNETFQPIPEGNLPLHKAFFAPFRIVEEGGIDPILRGLFGKAAKKPLPEESLNTELTEKLFKLAHEVALDLAALNIQRNRDHGLPGYTEYRNYCGLPPVRTFNDLRREIPNSDVRRKLQNVYGHPDNIDMWTGGLSEKPVEGSKVGPTFLCLLAEQFRRLRAGDRFWYENPGVFSPAQLTELRHTTLGRVICENSDAIDRVQKDVFQMADYPSGYHSCENDDIPRVNFKVWAQCCHDCSRSGQFSSVTSHIYRGRRSVDEFSYPEDRPQSEQPSPPLPQSLDNRGGDIHHHLHKTAALGAAGETHNGNETMGHMHTMMDAVDVRIEGVEDVMVAMQKTIQKLTKKVRKMERSRRKDAALCIDDDGNKRNHGDEWREHDCRDCRCENGKLECLTTTCQLPHCDYPVKRPGECCPVCL